MLFNFKALTGLVGFIHGPMKPCEARIQYVSILTGRNQKREEGRMRLSFAMVCSSNQNRSMEAHALFKRHALDVASYGEYAAWWNGIRGLGFTTEGLGMMIEEN
jgi:Ssu72-like protein